MIPPLSIRVRPIRGGKLQAIVTDLSGDENLVPEPGRAWQFFTNEFWVERKSFDKAALAAAERVGKNVELIAYRALIKAQGDAHEVCVQSQAPKEPPTAARSKG